LVGYQLACQIHDKYFLSKFWQLFLAKSLTWQILVANQSGPTCVLILHACLLLHGKKKVVQLLCKSHPGIACCPVVSEGLSSRTDRLIIN
jgi:hypothetical protein